MPRSHLVGVSLTLACGCALENNPDFDGPPPAPDSATEGTTFASTTEPSATATAATTDTATTTSTSTSAGPTASADPTLPLTTGESCSEGAVDCLDPSTLLTCVGGMWIDSPCDGICEPGLGCQAPCNLGETLCEGPDIYICTGQSFAYLETCPAKYGLTCTPGFDQCTGPCSPLTLLESPAQDLGCDFYATALANPAGVDFDVTIVGAPGTNAYIDLADVEITSIVLPAGGAATISLKGAAAIATPTGSAKVNDAAHRIRTDAPVRATQHNSLASPASRDTATLLPTHRWPLAVTISTVGTPVDEPKHRGFFAIIAHYDGTEVTVTPPPNPLLKIEPLEGLTVNAQGVLSLNSGDVAQVIANSTYDLSRIRLASNAPIQAFSGHRCAEIPAEANVTECDHIETVLLATDQGSGTLFYLHPPLKESGGIFITHAYAARIFAPLGATGTAYFAGGSYPFDIAAGSFKDLATDKPMKILSDNNPLLVFQYGSGLGLGQESLTAIPAYSHLPTVVDIAFAGGQSTQLLSLSWIGASPPTLDGVPIANYAPDPYLTGMKNTVIQITDAKRHTIQGANGDRVLVLSNTFSTFWSARTFHGLE